MKASSPQIRPSLLAALRRIDTASVADAVRRFANRPEASYSDHRLRHMLPELGSFIGFAVTIEVTTNDADSPALSFFDHYQHMMKLKQPLVAVFKDVDSQPGRGASFGEGMSVLHRKCGAVAAIIDGTVRDMAGLKKRGFPVMAWGAVPGHGRFKAVRLNCPVTICGLRILPGDLLQGDVNGCVRIPVEHAEEVLRIAREGVAREKKLFPMFERASLQHISESLNWESR